ncbi:MAG TPA: hypothetical protein VI789_00120 [Dehalococcoidia bacterium]|nr:hypothetical protein [Dehalococcoidia bacterium]
MGRLSGVLVCVVTAAVGLVYLWGLTQEDLRFWAVAIPVSLGIFVVLALVFWVGWTMVATSGEPAPSSEPPPPPPA